MSDPELLGDVTAFIPTVLEVTGALALKHFRAELFAELALAALHSTPALAATMAG